MHKFKLIALLGLALTTTLILTGCEEESGADITHETTTQIGKTASVNTKAPELESTTSNHTVTVNGQSFGLKASYGISKSRLNNWYFAQPSSVSVGAQTQNLPDNLKVKVSEIYAEVAMVSNLARYNGVRQDSMDIQYTTLPSGGIAIDNNNDFKVPFQVEGINANENSFYIINGYGASETSRITESELRDSVQGGALKTVWTLLITDTKTGNTYGQTVQDSIGLPYKHNTNSN